jgi:hypothetical protein
MTQPEWSCNFMRSMPVSANWPGKGGDHIWCFWVFIIVHLKILGGKCLTHGLDLIYLWRDIGNRSKYLLCTREKLQLHPPDFHSQSLVRPACFLANKFDIIWLKYSNSPAKLGTNWQWLPLLSIVDEWILSQPFIPRCNLLSRDPTHPGSRAQRVIPIEYHGGGSILTANRQRKGLTNLTNLANLDQIEC